MLNTTKVTYATFLACALSLGTLGCDDHLGAAHEFGGPQCGETGVPIPTAVLDTYDGSPTYPLVAGNVVSPPVGMVVTAPHGVLENDLLSCGGADTIVVDALPIHGGLTTMEADGDFVYTPSAGADLACVDRFRYHLVHQTYNSNETTVWIDYQTCNYEAWVLDEYVYFGGCLDPRTNPWGIVRTFTIPDSSRALEVDLSTDVPLRVEVVSQPSNGRVVASAYSFVFTPTVSGASSGRVSLRITEGRCIYEATAVLQVSR